MGASVFAPQIARLRCVRVSVDSLYSLAPFRSFLGVLVAHRGIPRDVRFWSGLGTVRV